MKILNAIAPRSRKDLLHKIFAFWVIIVLWDLLWTRVVLGLDGRSVAVQSLDTLIAGGPFVVLFYLGSWQQVQLLKLFRQRSTVDPLSGLKNRQTFLNQLPKILPRSREGLLMLIDADHFKKVNDEFGHAVGDKCIAAIGHRLNWTLREGDLSGRIGGEEFAVFLPNVNETQGRAVTQRIGQPVTFVDDTTGDHHTITLSIGGVWTRKGQNSDDQLLLADDALYRAKAQGRARAVFSNLASPIPLVQQPVQSKRPHGVDTRAAG